MTAAIQKEYTIVYFIQSKIKNLILSFFIWNFAIESISFSKGKEFNNGFSDWHRDVWLLFSYYFHERSSIGKKQRDSKMWYNVKIFIIKPVYCFNLMTVSDWFGTFWNWRALLLLYPYINFDWRMNFLCMTMKLWTMNYV